MQGKYLIAFGKKPKSGQGFLDMLVQMSKNDGIAITGAVLCPGPGCSNLALIVDNDDHKNFVEQLTMILMPAKYENCDDPRLVEGQFLVEGFD